MKLLLVDDDEPFRTRLARSLRARGIEVGEAASCGDAPRAARELKPDRALIDLRMADGSGLDVLAAAKQRAQNTEVILFTAHNTVENAISAMSAGAFLDARRICPRKCASRSERPDSVMSYTMSHNSVASCHAIRSSNRRTPATSAQ